MQLPNATSTDRAPTILLSDQQAAELLCMSVRKFHDIRPMLPRPVVLGPRMVRWIRTELEQAVTALPRQADPQEPAQLRRGKIEALKSRGVPA